MLRLNYLLVKPRLILSSCMATVGAVSKFDHQLIVSEKQEDHVG